MKILDRYIAKNFLTGYVIAFCVLIGLRIIIDLFVNMDEFAEHADLGTRIVLWNILKFYTLNTTLYFRDFAGMITVVAAAFSLGRMIRSNELIAMMASGISLKRVVGPILTLALVFSAVFILDQEVVIPAVSHKLVRSQDDLPGKETYKVWFITDGNGSLICSPLYDANSCTLQLPTIIERTPIKPGLWRVTGKISADKAVYNFKTKQWDLINGRIIHADSNVGFEPKATYASANLLPRDIPVRVKAEYMSYLSFHQLNALSAQSPKDIGRLYSQKHFRITDPMINFVTLMVSLPLLVCRDPRAMKSAVLLSFLLTTACSLFTFMCKMLATEEIIFSRLVPEFWAWLPIFVFLPIAFVELDAMKT